MHERRFDPAAVHKLEDPQRLRWMPPAEVISRLGLAPGMAVADIGAGTGFFAIPMARAVAPNGIVWAVDVQPALLEHLAAKLKAAEAPGNIRLAEGEAAATALDAHSVDAVLLANIWHELDSRPAALAEAARLLKPGGRLAILDWRPGLERPPGPPLEHRVAPEAVVEDLQHAGWRLLKSDLIGPYSYLVIADKHP